MSARALLAVMLTAHAAALVADETDWIVYRHKNPDFCLVMPKGLKTQETPATDWTLGATVFKGRTRVAAGEAPLQVGILVYDLPGEMNVLELWNLLRTDGGAVSELKACDGIPYALQTLTRADGILYRACLTQGSLLYCIFADVPTATAEKWRADHGEMVQSFCRGGRLPGEQAAVTQGGGDVLESSPVDFQAGRLSDYDGKVVRCQGRVKSISDVVVVGLGDGNQELVVFPAKPLAASTLPPGTLVVCQGRIQLVRTEITGTDYHYTPDGRQTATTTTYRSPVQIRMRGAVIVEAAAAATLAAPVTTRNVPDDQRDWVEVYVNHALERASGPDLINAAMFRPDDQALAAAAQTKCERLQLPPDASAKVDAILHEGLFNDLDTCRGPAPSAETDQIEARILMDPDVVGDGLCHPHIYNSARDRLLVFLAPCRLTMSQFEQRYGPAVETIQSNDKLHFYGRIIVFEQTNGRVRGIVRRGSGWQ